MKSIKKIFIVLLILLTFNLYLPNVTLAEQGPTKHPLEIRSTPPEDIPKIKVKKPSGWKWLIVVGLIGGAAYALGGDDDDGGGTGGVTGTW